MKSTLNSCSKARRSYAKLSTDSYLIHVEIKLIWFSPLPGVLDRIAALRARHEKITASIAQYERSTADQSEQLRKMSRSTSFAADDMDDEQHEGRASTVGAQRLTQDDLKREEDLVKELERRKKVLEERVDGMKKDIGGILR